MKKGIIIAVILCSFLISNKIKAETVSDQDFLNSFLNDCTYYIDGGTSVSNTTCGWNNNFRTATINTNNISGQGTIHFKSTNFDTTRQLLVPGTTNTWLNPSKVQFQVRVDYTLFPLEEIYVENNPATASTYYSANVYENGISFNFFPVYSSETSETGGGGGLCEVNHGNNDGRYKYYTITCNIPSKAYGISDLRMSYYYTRTTTQSYTTTVDVGISTNVNWLFTGILQAQMYASENNQTQSIIQAQENATQQQIESQQVCEHIDKNKIIKQGVYITGSGNEGNTTQSFGVTDYIKISSNDNLKIIETVSSTTPRVCFYNTNKTFISCVLTNTLTQNQKINIPINASYMRLTINYEIDKPQYQLCINGNQAIVTQNHNYDSNATKDYTNQTEEINNITMAEDQLLNNLDLNTTDMNITINPNASIFIWNIVNGLRSMNGAIVLLMTSLLSMGIIKLVLGR